MVKIDFISLTKTIIVNSKLFFDSIMEQLLTENTKKFFFVTKKNNAHNYAHLTNILNVSETDTNSFCLVDRDSVYKHYTDDDFLYEVKLPLCDPNFKMMGNNDGIYLVNGIIIGKKYNLYDVETAKILGLVVTPNAAWRMFNSCIETNINHYGYYSCSIDMLKWLEQHNLKFMCVQKEMDYVSLNCDIIILDWWKNVGSKLCVNKLEDLFTERAIDNLTPGDPDKIIKLLEWWKNSGLPLKYTEQSMDEESFRYTPIVLDWWKDSGLEMKYSNMAIYYALEFSNVIILDWWKKSNLLLKYDLLLMDKMTSLNEIHALEWLKNSGLEIKYDINTMTLASETNAVAALDWWKKSGLKLLYSVKDCMNTAIDRENYDVVIWWIRSGLMKQEEISYYENLHFYKVTNPKEKHHGYHYTDGLNILKEKFNDDPKATCVPGGFYFTTKKYIHQFYGYGDNLRIIKIPFLDQQLKMVRDPAGNKWRSNRIILCEKYDLTNIETYPKLDLQHMKYSEVIEV